MINLQPIYDIPQLCYLKGVRDVVLSPGSRCAPITLAFARHTGIRKMIFPDERSAAFTAMGLSRLTHLPTVLVCTSGSAAYNYAPAVAEAYFQQIPLLILTADRPPEWIDQLDGQTIRQNDLYGRHVKASFTYPSDFSHPDKVWHAHRVLNEALNAAVQYPPGPVHINIPLREPFYPTDSFEFSQNLPVIEALKPAYTLASDKQQHLQTDLKSFSKILIVAGQADAQPELTNLLERLPVPVVADIISNHLSEKLVTCHDRFLGGTHKPADELLAPELLITFGNAVISKSLKGFLRKNRPVAHWHIQPGTAGSADTYQTLSRQIPMDPFAFFEMLEQVTVQTGAYKKTWHEVQQKVAVPLSQYLSAEPFSELEVIDTILRNIPEHSVLHLANSMPVRYANFAGLSKKNIEVVSNRGTSGIDGVISTAYGTALATDKLVTVLTGDMSFLYDRNAFWNNHLPSNLRIVLLNNHGGGIFRMIDGPARQPEGEEYFVTRQPLTAENTMKDFDVDYRRVATREAFGQEIAHFYDRQGKSKVLEIETDGNTNTEVWKKIKAIM
jgi:2-succinyl-5-enolpyruvyl-6-hydroxy-3-cyclohexene-1-carboxylate synthase